MPCPPGPGCDRRPDCQDGHCPGRPSAAPMPRRVTPEMITARAQAAGGIPDTAEWLHIRPGGAVIDGPAGTATGQSIPFGRGHSAADTEGAFWLPPADPPSPLARLDDAIERMISSTAAWLALAVMCIFSAALLGLLAGHIAELGPDRFWALLVGAPK